MNVSSSKVIPARAIFISVVLVTAPLAGLARAQDRPAPAVEVAVGSLFFPDDALVTEGVIGAAGRFYLLPRLSVGPEIAFIAGERHDHLMLTGNVTFDFIGPERGQPPPVTPFVVVGGGLFRTREEFPFNETFVSSDGAFTAGGGVRARVGSRVFVGAEARIGWELHLRLNGIVGIRLGQ
jgi:hypothetical protein